MPKIDSKTYELQFLTTTGKWQVVDKGSHSYIYRQLQIRSDDFKEISSRYKIMIAKKVKK